MRYVQICERCGRVFPKEDAECPKCHFNKEEHQKEILEARKEIEAQRKKEIPADMVLSTEYKTCAKCNLLIPKTQKKCPICGCQSFNKYYYRIRGLNINEATWNYKTNEGTGRGHHGAACDICPVCHGSSGWCPLLD